MKRPNIFFLSIDTLRYDALGAQGDRTHYAGLGVEKRETLPFLDGWVARGAFFPRAASVATYTTSAHASVLSGLYPPGHGVRAFLKTRLYPEVRTLPEVLGAAGYRSILYTDTIEFFRYPGLMKGFDTTVSTEADLLNELDRPDDRPVFLFVHWFDVHSPYLFTFSTYRPGVNDDFVAALEDLERKFRLGSARVPWDAGKTIPDRYWAFIHELSQIPEGRQAQFDLYLRGARKFDEGRLRFLLDELSRRPFFADLFFACFSDHGEGYYPGEKVLTHGGALTEETSRIALFLWHSRGLKPRVALDPASLVDLAPTALDFAGLSDRLLPFSAPPATSPRNPEPPSLPPPNPEPRTQNPEPSLAAQGLSLLPALEGNPLPPRVLYQEVWNSFQKAAATQAPLDADSWFRRHAEHPVTLYQRAVRGRRHKLLVRGQESRDLKGPMRRADAEEFVRLCYRGILGRHEDPEGFERRVAQLRRWGDGRFARRLLAWRISSSAEMKGQAKYLLHDYVEDAAAARPIGPTLNPALWAERRRLLGELRRISGISRDPAPPVEMDSPSDAKEMAEMLSALGYVDGQV